MLLEAVNAAKEAEVVVLAIGEDRLQSGEATSNANIRIPEIQQRLLERVSEVNENVVVVLFNGRPLDLRDVVSKAKAVLEVWMPGTEGANAIADVVFGAYAPSGKLTMSFPYSVGQVPVHYNEYSTGRPHVPGKDKDRFRSKYLDIPNAPLFPFGYGLGYTSFAISDVKLDKAELGMEDEIKASVTVEKHRRCKGNRDRTALHPRRSRIRGTPGERAERFLQGNPSAGRRNRSHLQNHRRRASLPDRK